MAKEDVRKKIEENKLQAVKSKKEREAEAVVQVGGKQKNNRAPRKKHQEEQEDIFSNIDISLLNLFGFLKVSPPMEKEALEPKIAELTAKLEHFTAEGIRRLDEEEEQVLSGKVEDPEEQEEAKEVYH